MGRDKPHPHPSPCLPVSPCSPSLPPSSWALPPHTCTQYCFFPAGSVERMSDMAAHIQSSDCCERSQGMREGWERGTALCSAISPGEAVHRPGSGWMYLMLQRGRFSPLASHPYLGKPDARHTGRTHFAPRTLLRWFIRNLSTRTLKADHYYSLLERWKNNHVTLW